MRILRLVRGRFDLHASRDRGAAVPHHPRNAGVPILRERLAAAPQQAEQTHTHTHVCFNQLDASILAEGSWDTCVT